MSLADILSVRAWDKAQKALVQKRQYASLTSLFAQLFIELAEWHRPLYQFDK